MRVLLFLLLLSSSTGSRSTGSADDDPRHEFDPRCPPAVSVDAPGIARPCARCEYLTTTLLPGATVSDCATACCGDWSCLSFRFTPGAPDDSFSGVWANHDSLRGVSNLTLTAHGATLNAVSANPAKAFWRRATGARAGTRLYLCFDCDGGDARNNRTGVVAADGQSITLERLPFDPAGFTQVFVRLGPAPPTCVFMDDTPPPANSPAGSADVTGVRAWLPPRNPAPFAQSTFIARAVVNASALYGADGDEFPTTWAGDGNQYSGAGDNTQPSPGVPEHYNSPATLFRVSGPPDAPAFAVRGDPVAISDAPFAKANCPSWNRGRLANIKSSGVLALSDTLIWAVSCFNYGDRPLFNRQRYGPAWLVASGDAGATWAQTAMPPLFVGRLAAPRFVQAGRAYASAPDPAHVYALFPGTFSNESFFELNDAAWLGRAPVAAVLDRAAWEFYVGSDGAGGAMWASDDASAVPVLSFPNHTSLQQVNYHAGIGRYVAANWAWVSADGTPRPDHSPDERNDRTARQRTWLMLLEAPQLWGPWTIFHSDDDWRYADGSSGAYTPIFPPAWINETAGGVTSMHMVSTQCCGVPQFLPTNHYSFNVQRVDLELA